MNHLKFHFSSLFYAFCLGPNLHFWQCCCPHEENNLKTRNHSDFIMYHCMNIKCKYVSGVVVLGITVYILTISVIYFWNGLLFLKNTHTLLSTPTHSSFFSVRPFFLYGIISFRPKMYQRPKSLAIYFINFSETHDILNNFDCLFLCVPVFHLNINWIIFKNHWN